MRSALPALFLLFILAACGDDTDGTPKPPTGTDTSAMVVPIQFKVDVNGAPFHLDSLYTTTHGVPFRVSNLRWYLSRVALLDSVGDMTNATLCDSAGNPVPFGVHMMRADTPGTMGIYIKAYPGTYHGFTFGIGVPGTLTFDTLNHGDASLHGYPLNVDADMYWGWKAGYIFFKVEGTSIVGDSARSFLYHIGDDKRYVVTQFETPITIVRGTSTPIAVGMNLARLFTAPDGSPSPNLGSAKDRVVMGGAMLDTVVRNMRESNVFTLKP